MRMYRGLLMFAAISMMGLGAPKESHAWSSLTWNDISQPDRLLQQLTRPKCPKGFERSRSGTTTYCLIRGLKLPGKAKADCAQLSEGTLGFSLPKAPPGYTCPEGMKAMNRHGQFGCYYSGLVVFKDGPELRPYCSYLDRGYLGFSYHQN